MFDQMPLMQLLKNIFANFIGKLWGAFSYIILFPVYISILGFDSFALIAFSLVLVGFMVLFDMGLKGTLSRSLARGDMTKHEKSVLVGTLETIYFFIAGIVFALLFLGTPYIVYSWLGLTGADATLGEFVFRAAAIEISLQLLLRFYFGGLLGLEQQVLANKYLVLWGIIRNAAVIGPILLFPNLYVFFAWQAIVTILFVYLFRLQLKTSLPHSGWRIFSFDRPSLKSVWRFAAGVFLIAFVASINTQLDKLVISRMLSLEHLGVYTLAIAIGTGLLFVSSPVSTAILPRLTMLFTQQDTTNAQRIYSLSCQSVTLVITILVVILCLQKTLILQLWLNDPVLSSQIMPVLPIIAIAYGALSIMTIPYAAAISQGITSINNIIGLVSLAVTIPGYLIFIPQYGLVGGAAVFLGVQLIGLFIYVIWVNHRCLKLSVTENIGLNLVSPFIIGVILTWGVFAFLPEFSNSRLAIFFTLFYKTILTISASLIVWIALLQRTISNTIVTRFRMYFA